MNERIRKLRKILKLSQRVFGDCLGLRQTTISFLERDGSFVSEQNIKSICSRFGVDEDWLRTGIGNMYLDIFYKRYKLCENFQKLSPIFQDFLLEFSESLLDTQHKM